jgi:hypothetical protein
MKNLQEEMRAELAAAHTIIKNALNIMTLDQKAEWAKKNAADRVDGEGITRANERAAVIARANEGQAKTPTARPRDPATPQPR